MFVFYVCKKPKTFNPRELLVIIFLSREAVHIGSTVLLYLAFGFYKYFGFSLCSYWSHQVQVGWTQSLDWPSSAKIREKGEVGQRKIFTSKHDYATLENQPESSI